MRIEVSPEDLRPIVASVVAELSDRLAPVDDRIAVGEREAARLLGLNWNQLRDCRRRGEIRAVKVGKSWLYRRADLVRWLAEQEAGR